MQRNRLSFSGAHGQLRCTLALQALDVIWARSSATGVLL